MTTTTRLSFAEENELRLHRIADEVYHQTYALGGMAEPVSALDVTSKTIEAYNTSHPDDTPIDKHDIGRAFYLLIDREGDLEAAEVSGPGVSMVRIRP